MLHSLRYVLFVGSLMWAPLVFGQAEQSGATRYVRFQTGNTTAYGIVEGDQVRQLAGDLFGAWTRTDNLLPLKDVKILVPSTPTQVLALAGNYKSHLGSTDIPKKLQIPQPFFKSPSCLTPHNSNIVLPKNHPGEVHYEAELVIVIGKRCSKVSKEKALDYVFGVTVGNDVSERYWQNDPENKDVQWWRAKGSDTFGPCGPFIVSGVDYGNLQMTLKLNGEVRQNENTKLFIQDIPTTVSFISQHITLHPGDLIFTGTPGKTAAMKAGDVVEIELEHMGVLRNTVVDEE